MQLANIVVYRTAEGDDFTRSHRTLTGGCDFAAIVIGTVTQHAQRAGVDGLPPLSSPTHAHLYVMDVRACGVVCNVPLSATPADGTYRLVT